MVILTESAQLRKLVTKEDGKYYHVHKILGILSLGHYIYRFMETFQYGHMRFDDSWCTLICIIIHTLLSCSSMIFHLPTIRNPTAPMIWPEFRLHSIIFALRSLIIMFLHWFSLRYDVIKMLGLRAAVVLLTMVFADEATRISPPQGSTMRVMPFPSFISENSITKINFFIVCVKYMQQWKY